MVAGWIILCYASSVTCNFPLIAFAIDSEDKHTMSSRTSNNLRPGVYAPILTPYKDEGTGAIDLEAFSRSVARLARADVGMIIAGTLGEGPLLDQEERTSLAKCAKSTLESLNLEDQIPLIIGVMGASVRECVAQSKAAAEAGANAVYVADSLFPGAHG